MFSIQSYVYAPPRGAGPICAIQGQTADAGASMSTARVETPSASSSNSSPASRAPASESVAPHVRIGERRKRKYTAAATKTVARKRVSFIGPVPSAKTSTTSSVDRTPSGRCPTTSITTRCETPCSVIRRAASSSGSCGTAVTAGLMAVPPARWPSSGRTVAAATRSRSDTTPHSDLATRGFSVTTTQCTRSADMRAATARSDVSGVQWISPQCIASATLGLARASSTVIGAVSDTT